MVLGVKLREFFAGRVDEAGLPLRCPTRPGTVTPLYAGRPSAGMAARVRVSLTSNMRHRVLRYVFVFWCPTSPLHATMKEISMNLNCVSVSFFPSRTSRLKILVLVLCCLS